MAVVSPSRAVLIIALLLAASGLSLWLYAARRLAPGPDEIQAKDLHARIGTMVTFRGVVRLPFLIGPFVELGEEQVLLSSMPPNIADGTLVIVRGYLEHRTPVPVSPPLPADAPGMCYIMKDESVRLIP